jgi:hypothetical protein
MYDAAHRKIPAHDMPLAAHSCSSRTVAHVIWVEANLSQHEGYCGTAHIDRERIRRAKKALHSQGK